MKRLFNTYNEAGESIAGPLPYAEAVEAGRRYLNKNAEANRYAIREDGNAEAKTYEYQRPTSKTEYRASQYSATKHGEEKAEEGKISTWNDYGKAKQAAISWLAKNSRRRVAFVQLIKDGKTAKEYTIAKAAHRFEEQFDSLEND